MIIKTPYKYRFVSSMSVTQVVIYEQIEGGLDFKIDFSNLNLVNQQLKKITLSRVGWICYER